MAGDVSNCELCIRIVSHVSGRNIPRGSCVPVLNENRPAGTLIRSSFVDIDVQPPELCVPLDMQPTPLRPRAGKPPLRVVAFRRVVSTPPGSKGAYEPVVERLSFSCKTAPHNAYTFEKARRPNSGKAMPLGACWALLCGNARLRRTAEAELSKRKQDLVEEIEATAVHQDRRYTWSGTYVETIFA